mgnify:CR=1 FL=1
MKYRLFFLSVLAIPFSFISCQPGSSAAIQVELEESAFTYYHPDELTWVLESGDNEIQVGNSSRDIKLSGNVIW